MLIDNDENLIFNNEYKIFKKLIIKCNICIF